jgi:transcriptional regulator with XRE-family HTH domain
MTRCIREAAASRISALRRIHAPTAVGHRHTDLTGQHNQAYASAGLPYTGEHFSGDRGAGPAGTVMANETVDWREWMRGLGRQVRRVREFLGLSQDQVARLAGVSQGAVSRLEAGRGLATPMVVVLKVHWVLTRALRAFDPAIPDEEVRATLGLESLIAPPTDRGSREPPPITRDADLEMLVQLYRTLPERQRRTLVAVARATASSLGDVAPSAAEMKVSHAGS